MMALWRYLGRPARPGLVVALALAAASGFAGVALLGLSGWFITASAVAGLAGAGYAFNHLYPSAGVRGFALGQVASRYFEQLVGHDATLRIAAALRPKVFAASARAKRGVGPLAADLLSALIDDVKAVEGGALRVVLPVAGWAAGVLVAVALSFAVSLLFGIAVTGGFALAAYALWRAAARRHRALGEEAAAAGADLREASGALIDGAAELDVYDAVNEASERVRAASERTLTAHAAVVPPFRRLSAAASAASAAAAGAALMVGHHVGASPAVAAAAAFAILAAAQATAAFAAAAAAAPKAEAAADRVRARLDAAPAVAEPDLDRAAPVGSVLPIRFKGLVAAPSHDGPSIGPMDAQIAPGEATALVGPSGAGKSTVLETLLRLHDPVAGDLAFAGTSWGQVRAAAVRAHIALSPQTATLPPGPVADILRLARPDADDAALWAALETAAVASAVRARPDGLSTRIDEASTGFSGGESRRIGLARALLAEPQVLLLDEPFAGLDPVTADAVADNLARWVQEGERALVVAAHAPVSRLADRVPTHHVLIEKARAAAPLSPATERRHAGA